MYKAQSAMEYLITYSWAILIIAVVLGTLFYLGVFNSSYFIGISCLANPGFLCANVTLNTSGMLSIKIGQATQKTFNNAYVYFVPQGSSFSTSNPNAQIGTLQSGQQVVASIPLGVGSPFPSSYTLGAPISGNLYVRFTDSYGITETMQIGTVNAKVVTFGLVTLSKPSLKPPQIAYYIPIQITNSQTSNTPSPFQQMVQFQESPYSSYLTYNGNIANFEFFYPNGTIIPAWIESNSSGTLTVWLKLAKGIGASSSLVVYLGFASKTTNLLSSSGTTGIGEAPQLSSTYAQYDDGASVFNYYQRFGSLSSIPTGWSRFGTQAFDFQPTYIGMYSTGANGGITIPVSNIGISGFPFVYDFYGSLYNQDGYMAASRKIVGILKSLPSASFSLNYSYVISGPGYGFDTVYLLGDILNNQYDYVDTKYIPSSFPVVYSLLATSPHANTFMVNYSLIATFYPVLANNLLYFVFAHPSISNSQFQVYWFRIRAHPPNAIMPSSIFED
ncbi:MAG: hypothetical protein QW582_01690 [Candidatus Micrarchaeaceae archaeon]